MMIETHSRINENVKFLFNIRLLVLTDLLKIEQQIRLS